MENAVAVRDTGSVPAAYAENPWVTVGQEAAFFDGNYVRLNANTGQIIFGKEDDEMPAGTELAVNMAGVQHGWACWQESKVTDRKFVILEVGPLPREDSLPDHGPYKTNQDGSVDGWSEQHNLPMVDSEGTKYQWQCSNQSAINAAKKFYLDYGKKRSQHIDENGVFQIPIVKVEVGSYMPKDKKRGKKYFPKFEIVRWVNQADVVDLFLAESDPEGGADDAANYADTAPVAQKQLATPVERDEDDGPKVVTRTTPKEEPKPVEKAEKPATEKATEGRRGKRF